MRAKFNCTKVTTEPYGEEVELWAVYSGDSNSEDNEFSQATPAGHITMTVSNPTAFGFLQEGKSYYLDFSEAPKIY